MHSPNNRRITVKSLLYEAWHTISHVEEGLQKTFVSLATRPGKMIRDYINGHRSGYHKPFPFLFIVTTVYAILLYWLHGHTLQQTEIHSVDFQTRFIANINYIESKYYSWLHIAFLPVYGALSLLIFRQAKFNWAEWMVACCYIVSFILILLIPYQLLNAYFNFSNETNFYVQLIVIVCYAIAVMSELVKSRYKLLLLIQTVIWCVSVFVLFLYSVQAIAWWVSLK